MSKSKRQHSFYVPEAPQPDLAPEAAPATPDAVPTADAVKTMVERAAAHKVWFGCLNDEQRAFIAPASGVNACEPFCPVCGYRMVRLLSTP